MKTYSVIVNKNGVVEKKDGFNTFIEAHRYIENKYPNQFFRILPDEEFVMDNGVKIEIQTSDIEFDIYY